jgi:hypothetical protein
MISLTTDIIIQDGYYVCICIQLCIVWELVSRLLQATHTIDNIVISLSIEQREHNICTKEVAVLAELS